MKLKSLLVAAIISIIGLSLWLNASDGNTDKNHQTIAITQIVDHPSLNQARAGLIDALAQAGYKEGENLHIIYQNPQGNMSVAAQIAKSLNQRQPDVIVAISTTSAQTVLSSNQQHNPIVFSSVTDPIQAQLVSNLSHPGADITGTMELGPVDALMALCHEILPQAKTIGIIYNPGEANSLRGVQLIEGATHLEVVKAPIQNSAEISQAINSIINKVDVIILPSDNTVWSALDKLVQIATAHQIPVLTSDPDSAKKGVLLALGYAQYDIGHDAGKKVVRILQGEKPGEIPITVPEKSSLYINIDSAKKLQIQLPESILEKAQHIRES